MSLSTERPIQDGFISQTIPGHQTRQHWPPNQSPQTIQPPRLRSDSSSSVQKNPATPSSTTSIGILRNPTEMNRPASSDSRGRQIILNPSQQQPQQQQQQQQLLQPLSQSLRMPYYVSTPTSTQTRTPIHAITFPGSQPPVQVPTGRAGSNSVERGNPLNTSNVSYSNTGSTVYVVPKQQQQQQQQHQQNQNQNYFNNDAKWFSSNLAQQMPLRKVYTQEQQDDRIPLYLQQENMPPIDKSTQNLMNENERLIQLVQQYQASESLLKLSNAVHAASSVTASLTADRLRDHSVDSSAEKPPMRMLNAANESIRILEDDVKTLNAVIDVKQKALEKKELDYQRQASAHATERLSFQEQIAKLLKSESRTDSKKLAMYEEQLNELQGKYENKGQELMDTIYANSKLKKDLETSTATIEQLTVSQHRLLSQIKSLEVEVKSIDTLQQKITQNQHLIDSLQYENKSHEEKILGLEEQLRETETTKELEIAVILQNESLNEQVSTLNARIAQMEVDFFGALKAAEESAGILKEKEGVVGRLNASKELLELSLKLKDEQIEAMTKEIALLSQKTQGFDARDQRKTAAVAAASDVGSSVQSDENTQALIKRMVESHAKEIAYHVGYHEELEREYLKKLEEKNYEILAVKTKKTKAVRSRGSVVSAGNQISTQEQQSRSLIIERIAAPPTSARRESHEMQASGVEAAGAGEEKGKRCKRESTANNEANREFSEKAFSEANSSRSNIRNVGAEVVVGGVDVNDECRDQQIRKIEELSENLFLKETLIAELEAQLAKLKEEIQQKDLQIRLMDSATKIQPGAESKEGTTSKPINAAVMKEVQQIISASTASAERVRLAEISSLRMQLNEKQIELEQQQSVHLLLTDHMNSVKQEYEAQGELITQLTHGMAELKDAKISLEIENYRLEELLQGIKDQYQLDFNIRNEDQSEHDLEISQEEEGDELADEGEDNFGDHNDDAEHIRQEDGHFDENQQGDHSNNEDDQYDNQGQEEGEYYEEEQYQRENSSNHHQNSQQEDEEEQQEEEEQGSYHQGHEIYAHGDQFITQENYTHAADYDSQEAQPRSPASHMHLTIPRIDSQLDPHLEQVVVPQYE